MTHERSIAVLCGAVAASLMVGLTGCGKQTSAVAPNADSGPSPAANANGYGGGSSTYGGSYAASDPRRAAIPQVNGKPMWAPNRNHTAEENAQYQFTKNGRDFAAASESDYVTKVHAFIDHPPGGVQTLDRRNGDKLLYDPKDNVFAVVSKDGAPRTMFKPRAGGAYWQEQKTRLDDARSGGAASDQRQG